MFYDESKRTGKKYFQEKSFPFQPVDTFFYYM